MAVSQKIVVDVVAPKNRSVSFPPCNTVLRSEIRLSEISGVRNIPSLLAQVGGVLPGHRIEVDPKSGTARIIERMAEPEHAELAAKVKKAAADPVLREKGIDARFTHFSKKDEMTYQLGEEPPHNLATWLYWMRRLVDNKRFRLESGTLPELDEIRKLGVIYISPDRGLQPKEGKKPFNYLYPPEPAGAAS